MQESLPEEIKQARWVVKDREELLGKARQDAETHRGAGPRGAARMARKEEIVQRAEEEAERIVAEAEQQAAGCGARPRTTSTPSSRSSRSRCGILEEAQSTSRALAKTLDQVGGRARQAPRADDRGGAGVRQRPEAQLFDAEEER